MKTFYQYQLQKTLCAIERLKADLAKYDPDYNRSELVTNEDMQSDLDWNIIDK
jgi:hypothetical protein